MNWYSLFVSVLIVAANGSSAATLQQGTIEVDALERTYSLYLPESEIPPPLVFVFHGHGGNTRNTSRSFAVHTLWPEACVVYMQGLKTPGKLTDPEGRRSGWQHAPGDQDDRDLEFFDAVYKSLKNKVDVDNVFATGHSNGGGFTYLLWHKRGDKLRAVAPSSAAANAFIRDMIREGNAKPVIHYAARKDPLVKYQWQMATLMQIHRMNGCAKKSQPWHSKGIIEGEIYPSNTGNPVVTLISDGDHKFPREAAELFVQFFKQQMIVPAAESESKQHEILNPVNN